MQTHRTRIALIGSVIGLALALARFGFTAPTEPLIAKVAINPLGVVLSLPAEAGIGRVFRAEVEAENKGEKKIEHARGELFVPPQLELLRGAAQEIGVISSQKRKRISWSLRGTATGAHAVVALVSGDVEGQHIQRSASATVVITEKPSPDKPFDSAHGLPAIRSILEQFFDFFRGWLGF